MKFRNYCADKISIILLNAGGMLVLSEYLSMVGNTASTIILIDVLWFVILCSCFFVGWYTRNKYFTELKKRVSALSQPWLISEVLPVSFHLEDREYQKVIRNIGAIAIEHIHKREDEQKEYEEFIENWIHEVKTPITLLYLMINNNIKDVSIKREIVMELKRIENDVESALYYARLGTAYKDYLIQKMSLDAVIKDAVSNNRVLLMSNRFAVMVCCPEHIFIYSDRKWILFMLNQVIINAVKYSKKENAKINIEVIEKDTTTELSIKDNGIGICAEDLTRIFEKGYTGKNGHNNMHSTGIGLYLVERMCEKLDVAVKVDSVEDVYTTISFSFKNKTYFHENLSKLQDL